MNWNAIAAVGELAGAVAVVVSLLYVARQINQNTRAMRRTASHDAVEGMLNWNATRWRTRISHGSRPMGSSDSTTCQRTRLRVSPCFSST